jgi:hypothetical protein
MADSQRGSFTPSTFFEPTIALSHVRFRSTHSMRSLDQRGSHIAIPVFASSAEPFAGTFLVSRADASPRTEMFSILQKSKYVLET